LAHSKKKPGLGNSQPGHKDASTRLLNEDYCRQIPRGKKVANLNNRGCDKRIGHRNSHSMPRRDEIDLPDLVAYRFSRENTGLMTPEREVQGSKVRASRILSSEGSFPGQKRSFTLFRTSMER
jgi:hypothetical protein